MFLKRVAFVFVMISVVFSFAEPTKPACESLASYKDVLNCAIENHPEVQHAKLLLNQNKYLIEIAEQRPNPELSSQFLNGKSGEDTYQYNQINLAHTFELGGKRDARIRRSQVQIDSSEIELRSTQEEIYLRTYLALIRLRQIASEIDVYEDALSTFERVQKQYRTRPRMTPEQQATFTIMDIAANDYRLKRMPLINEAREKEYILEEALGRKLDVRKEFYPPFRAKWPVLKAINNSISSIALKKTIAGLELAQSQLSEEKSLAWPNLKLGPTFEIQSQGGQRTNAFGLNLSFTIPLFHTNGGGRSYAATAVSRAEQILETTKVVENHQLELQRKKYEEAVSTLEGALSISDLYKKHQAIEKSFATGVVPSSLVIEIHRQMADYIKSLSEQENTAIEALARIYSIEGNLITEGL